MAEVRIAVVNGKGGVGKTSLVAHLLGAAALSGWKALGVDLDQQGNLARDLGYVDRSDGGEGLLQAAIAGKELNIISGVRHNLDVVSGGIGTRMLGDHLSIAALRGGPAGIDRLAEVLRAVDDDYDLVVLDLPPGEALIQQAAMRYARYLVIPTPGDEASNDGLGSVYGEMRAARQANVQLEVLGVVVTFVPTAARRLLRQIREDLGSMLGERVRIFEPPIRYAKVAAMDCRSRGMLAFEYEKAARSASSYWKARKNGTEPERFGGNAEGLAEDYQRLASQILGAAKKALEIGE